jgi:hypothetical protein
MGWAALAVMVRLSRTAVRVCIVTSGKRIAVGFHVLYQTDRAVLFIDFMGLVE